MVVVLSVVVVEVAVAVVVVVISVVVVVLVVNSVNRYNIKKKLWFYSNKFQV